MHIAEVFKSGLGTGGRAAGGVGVCEGKKEGSRFIVRKSGVFYL